MDDARLDAADNRRRYEQSLQQLLEAIANAPPSVQSSLLTHAQLRLGGSKLTCPQANTTTHAVHQGKNKRVRSVQQINKAEVVGEEATYSEIFDKLYDTVCDIAMGGIRNELELTTLIDAIYYAMKRDKFDGTLDDAIDYALCLAYDTIPVNEEAWLIALARFRLRGFGAPPWTRDAPQGRLG